MVNYAAFSVIDQHNIGQNGEVEGRQNSFHHLEIKIWKVKVTWHILHIKK